MGQQGDPEQAGVRPSSQDQTDAPHQIFEARGRGAGSPEAESTVAQQYDGKLGIRLPSDALLGDTAHERVFSLIEYGAFEDLDACLRSVIDHEPPPPPDSTSETATPIEPDDTSDQQQQQTSEERTDDSTLTAAQSVEPITPLKHGAPVVHISVETPQYSWQGLTPGNTQRFLRKRFEDMSAALGFPLDSPDKDFLQNIASRNGAIIVPQLASLVSNIVLFQAAAYDALTPRHLDAYQSELPFFKVGEVKLSDPPGTTIGELDFFKLWAEANSTVLQGSFEEVDRNATSGSDEPLAQLKTRRIEALEAIHELVREPTPELERSIPALEMLQQVVAEHGIYGHVIIKSFNQALAQFKMHWLLAGRDLNDPLLQHINPVLTVDQNFLKSIGSAFPNMDPSDSSQAPNVFESGKDALQFSLASKLLGTTRRNENGELHSSAHYISPSHLVTRIQQGILKVGALADIHQIAGIEGAALFELAVDVYQTAKSHESHHRSQYRRTTYDPLPTEKVDEWIETLTSQAQIGLLDSGVEALDLLNAATTQALFRNFLWMVEPGGPYFKEGQTQNLVAVAAALQHRSQ